MLIVYTTVFGITDPLHEPEVTDGMRFVCFTDRPLRSKHWEIVRTVSPAAPTRASRTLKALSHRVFPGPVETLWIDACFTLQADPRQFIGVGDFQNFVHPDRSRVAEEAEAVIRLGKAEAAAVRQQVAEYRAAGFDTDDDPMRALSCNGIIYRAHTPEVCRLNERWAEELARHTIRDQLSLDYAAWREDVALGRWPGDYRDNPLARFHYYRRPVND